MLSRTTAIAVFAALFLGAPARADEPSARELALQRQIDELRKDNELLRQLVASMRETGELKKSLAALEQKVDALSRPRVQTRIAGSLPESGTIRLENRLGMASTMIIDGVSYRLQPYEVRDLVSQPAGPFTFEVLVDGWGSRGRGTRNLTAGKTHTVFTYLGPE